MMGVRIRPGATTLDLIPAGASSHDADFANCTTAALARSYDTADQPASSPAMLEMDTMLPPLPCSTNSRAANLCPSAADLVSRLSVAVKPSASSSVRAV